MKQLTEEQIERFKKKAKQSTSVEDYDEDWNSYDISDGNYDNAYYAGCDDADIIYARFILDLFEIEY